MMFLAGWIVATVVWVAVDRFAWARVDRDIEARILALGRERTRRIFDRHCEPGNNYVLRDEQAAARDPEWSADYRDGPPSATCRRSCTP